MRLQILPLVEDDAWFFDTELIVTAERLGVRITETPVEWVDDPDSRVDIIATAAEDLRGIWRMAHGARLQLVRSQRPEGNAAADATADQLLSFAGVGVLSTLSYLLLFAGTLSVLGPWIANATALAFCTLVNTALHRSLARHAPGRPEAPSAPPPFALVLAVLYGVSLAATTAAIAIAAAVMGPSLVVLAVAATIANVAASPAPVLALAWVGLPRTRALVDAGAVTDLIDAPSTTFPAPARPARPAGAVPPSPTRWPPVVGAGLAQRCRPLLRPAGYYLASRVSPSSGRRSSRRPPTRSCASCTPSARSGTPGGTS